MKYIKRQNELKCITADASLILVFSPLNHLHKVANTDCVEILQSRTTSQIQKMTEKSTETFGICSL